MVSVPKFTNGLCFHEFSTSGIVIVLIYVTCILSDNLQRTILLFWSHTARVHRSDEFNKKSEYIGKKTVIKWRLYWESWIKVTYVWSATVRFDASSWEDGIWDILQSFLKILKSWRKPCSDFCSSSMKNFLFFRWLEIIRYYCTLHVYS